MRWLALLPLLLSCGEDAPPIPAPGSGAALPLDEVAAPQFPPRGAAEVIDGVRKYVIDLSTTNPGSTVPGHQGTLWVYLPDQQTALPPYPVVISAPWGGTQVSGVPLQERHQEGHLAYAKAGYAVVAFSVDGAEPESLEDATGWPAFAASYAGAVNAHNAWRYATGHLPEANPDRIFMEGFSGGGDTALLYATQQPELDGVALINSAGLGCWFQSGPLLARLSKEREGFYDVCTQTSPMAQLDKLTVPTLLFANEDDKRIPRMYVKTLHRHAEAAGAPATFYLAPSGGNHEQAWREQGLEYVANWFSELD